MAKAKKKTEIKLETTKTPEESSALFYAIIKASVKGNPKPQNKSTKKP